MKLLCMCIQVFEHMASFIMGVSRSINAGLHGKRICSFKRNGPNIFRVTLPFYIPLSSVRV